MISKLVRGIYTSGCNHSGQRPKFYESLGVWRGSINIQLPQGTNESLILPNKRVLGIDPIDVNQDFLIRPCRLKGVTGYQILPIDKATSEPRGHHSDKVIEIALREKIEIKLNEELEVELEGFEN
jgi:CTP-dependent riboflavin kinase